MDEPERDDRLSRECGCVGEARGCSLQKSAVEPRQGRRHDRTGENSRPINGEDSTPAYRPYLNLRDP